MTGTVSSNSQPNVTSVNENLTDPSSANPSCKRERVQIRSATLPPQTTARPHDHWAVRASNFISRIIRIMVNVGFMGSILVVPGVAAALLFGGFLSPFALGIVTMAILSIPVAGLVAFVPAILTNIVLGLGAIGYLAYNPSANTTKLVAWMARVAAVLQLAGNVIATLLGLGIVATAITLTAMGIVAPVVLPMAALIAGCVGAGIGAGLLWLMGVSTLFKIAQTPLSFAMPNAAVVELVSQQQTGKSAKTLKVEEETFDVNLTQNPIPSVVIGEYSNPLKNKQPSPDEEEEDLQERLNKLRGAV